MSQAEATSNLREEIGKKFIAEFICATHYSKTAVFLEIFFENCVQFL